MGYDSKALIMDRVALLFLKNNIKDIYHQLTDHISEKKRWHFYQTEEDRRNVTAVVELIPLKGVIMAIDQALTAILEEQVSKLDE